TDRAGRVSSATAHRTLNVHDLVCLAVGHAGSHPNSLTARDQPMPCRTGRAADLVDAGDDRAARHLPDWRGCGRDRSRAVHAAHFANPRTRRLNNMDLSFPTFRRLMLPWGPWYTTAAQSHSLLRLIAISSEQN